MDLEDILRISVIAEDKMQKKKPHKISILVNN